MVLGILVLAIFSSGCVSFHTTEEFQEQYGALTQPIDLKIGVGSEDYLEAPEFSDTRPMPPYESLQFMK